MEHITFSPKGVCSVKLDFDLEDGKLHNVSFRGGCNGNLKAIGRLVEGKDAREVADILRGNTCGLRGTSCADELPAQTSLRRRLTDTSQQDRNNRSSSPDRNYQEARLR